MNEMELLAGLRSEVPHGEVSPRSAELFFTGLAADQAKRGQQPGRPARSRALGSIGPRWRLAIAAGTAGVLAAGIVAAVGPSAGTRRTQTVTVAYVVSRAAAAAERQPAVRPGQWVYRKVAYVDPSYHVDHVYTYWARADDTIHAFYVRGRLIVGPWFGRTKVYGCARPVVRHHRAYCVRFRSYYLKDRLGFRFIPYAGLASLPAGPRALARFLAGKNPLGRQWTTFEDAPPLVTYCGSAGPPQHGRPRICHAYNPADTFAFRAFNVISYLLSVYVISPKLTAELYHALGDVPGIEVSRSVSDVAGRHGVGFILQSRRYPWFREEIILNPRTYRFMAFGGPQAGTALLRQALVSGPGVVPRA